MNLFAQAVDKVFMVHSAYISIVDSNITTYIFVNPSSKLCWY